MGGLTSKLIGIIIGVIVIAAVLVGLWPNFVATDTSVQSLSDNSTATTMVKTFWPIGLMVMGIGIAVAVIMIALKQFGLLGGSKSKF